MTFHIGSQRAGLISNVAGDQTVHGGQQGVASPAGARGALEVVRAELDELGMSRASARTARAYVEQIEQQLLRRQPDAPTVADRLGRLTKLLVAGGALLTGGTALGQAIGALASWLGPLGASVRGLLSPTTGH